MPVNWQPTLVGPLLELRPLCDDDWDALFAVAQDPLIWAQHPQSTRYQEPVFREFFAGAMASQGALIAIDRESGTVIGSSRFAEHDAEKREVEIGWTFLARAYWGGRYNGEMKQLMLQYAFQHVDRVRFVIGPNNRRSRLAVERIGGVFARAEVHRGEERVIYTITNPGAHAPTAPVEPAPPG